MITLSKALIVFCYLLGSLALAQDTVSIAGKVTDSNGVPIPGAAVGISSGADKIAETLKADGTYSFATAARNNTLTTEILVS